MNIVRLRANLRENVEEHLHSIVSHVITHLTLRKLHKTFHITEHHTFDSISFCESFNREFLCNRQILGDSGFRKKKCHEFTGSISGINIIVCLFCLNNIYKYYCTNKKEHKAIQMIKYNFALMNSFLIHLIIP